MIIRLRHFIFRTGVPPVAILLAALGDGAIDIEGLEHFENTGGRAMMRIHESVVMRG